MPPHESLLRHPIHEKVTFTVPAYGVDASKRLSIPHLIEQLQESALLSTRKLGVSVNELEPHKLAWVLLGQRVEIIRRPQLGEVCTVITAPTGLGSVLTYRDFHLLDESATPIARATTTWMLMETERRKMTRLPQWITEMLTDLPPESVYLPRAAHKLKPPTEPEMIRTFRVGFHELDYNGHLTNPVYPRWMLEGLPEAVLRRDAPVILHLQYAREACYGDHLSVARSGDPAGRAQQLGLYRADVCLAGLQLEWA